MLEWLIENEAFVSKDAYGVFEAFIVQNYDGHEKTGEGCNDPLDAIKSAMDSASIAQAERPKTWTHAIHDYTTTRLGASDASR